jgi:AcrR family transcriptional regulator
MNAKRTPPAAIKDAAGGHWPATAEGGSPTAGSGTGFEPSPSASARRSRYPAGAGLRLRGDIVAAAERLLAAAGDDQALSLRAVAREAKIAAPSIYLHFASKDELMRGLVADFFTALRDALVAAVADIDDPRDGLLTGCLAYCRFAAERPGAYRVLFLTPRTWAPRRPDDHDVGTDAFMVLVDGIAACQQSGHAPVADPQRLATDVWAALHGIATLRWAMPNFPWPSLDEQIRHVLSGLAGVRFDDSAAMD